MRTFCLTYNRGYRLADVALPSIAAILLGKHKLATLRMSGVCIRSIVHACMSHNKFSKAGLEQHMAPVPASLGLIGKCDAMVCHSTISSLSFECAHTNASKYVCVVMWCSVHT